MIKSEDVDKQFKQYDKRTVRCIKMLVDALEYNDSVVPEYYYMSLELLAVQLDIYFNAYDTMKKDGLFIKTKNGKTERNAAVLILQQSYTKIMDMIKESGATSMARRRMNRLKHASKEDNATKLLEILSE